MSESNNNETSCVCDPCVCDPSECNKSECNKSECDQSECDQSNRTGCRRVKVNKQGTVIDPREFDTCVKKLRAFFQGKGFTEVHTQCRLSINQACEDANTLATFNYGGQVWPLPQTNQMYLEEILLEQPELNGVYCVSTSFRNEPDPVPGRHDKIFPMFEFESRGTMEDMIKLEKELLQFMGFGMNESNGYFRGEYNAVAKKYDVKELGHSHEEAIDKDYGHVFFLTNFPEHTSPFWNMKFDKNTGLSSKVDVILHGVETIGSAERSCDVSEMREKFMKIDEGRYANKLFAEFGKQRVLDEVEEFLSQRFFPRFGGGIGVTRVIRGMKLAGLL